MSRHDALAITQPPCSPHTRGDVPDNQLGTAMLRVFSPHAWGCPVGVFERLAGVVVLPTRVGMSREARGLHALRDRSPHTRGDVPSTSR